MSETFNRQADEMVDTEQTVCFVCKEFGSFKDGKCSDCYNANLFTALCSELKIDNIFIDNLNCSDYFERTMIFRFSQVAQNYSGGFVPAEAI